MPDATELAVDRSRRMAATCAIGFEPGLFRAKLSLGGGRNDGLIRSHVLKVSKELTPGIEDAVSKACDNLGFPRAILDVYISPQSETNAYSSRDSGRALVIINAAMVEILAKEELTFVVGHEIGHFLLPEINTKGDDSLEGAIFSRWSELTMDRIGLLACRDADKACHAKIKMLSGLTERHLRMDIAALIADWNSHAREGAHESLLRSSHPPPGLRAKALLKFQGSDYYRNICGLEGGTPLSEVNKAALDELHRFVDGAADLAIKDQLNRLSGWAAGFAASHGIKVRLASFRTPNCDAPEDYVRQCIGVIIQDTPEAERKDKALRKFHEYLTSASATAPARTSAYLSHLAKEEPALGELISRIRVIQK